MSTHGGREMGIRRVTNALNNVGERAEPWEVPVLTVCGSE